MRPVGGLARRAPRGVGDTSSAFVAGRLARVRRRGQVAIQCAHGLVVERHADVLLGLAFAAHGQHVQALVLADAGEGRGERASETRSAL